MRLNSFAIALVLILGLCSSAFAQFQEGGDADGATLGKSRTQRWRAGIIITAKDGPCKGIVGYAPVPVDWPEQEVIVVDEDISPGGKISYRPVEGSGKVMVIKFPNLSGGKTAKALVTFEIRRSTLEPPEDTEKWKIPQKSKLDRKLRIYLGPSPYIQCRDSKIRNLAKEIIVDKEQAWEKAEAIYDWVQKNIDYEKGPLKGALKALRDKKGDCEELSSLFIGLCRASGIPARTVWVPEHCYAEFYLVDDKNNGYWFPCQPAGSREFGGITELRPILQKGDNFRRPDNRRERVRYLSERVTVARPTGKPGVTPVHELLGTQ